MKEEQLPEDITPVPTPPEWIQATPLTVVEPVVPPVAPAVSTAEAIRRAKANTPIAPAPITPAPTPAPVPTPIPVEEVKTEAVETPKQVEGAQINNVSEAEKTAQQTGVQYNLVNWQAQYTPKNKEEALKILQMGGAFAGESKLTAQAKASLENLRKLSGLNDTQLADYITQGKVSSADIAQLQTINPNLVAQAQQKAKNSSIAEVNNNAMSVYWTGELTYKNTAIDTLNQTLSEIDSNGGYAQIKEEVFAQYPEMDNLRQNITKTSVEIRGIQEAMRKQADDLKERFKGLPMSTILAMASTKNKPLTDQLYALQDQLTLDSAEYNAQLDQAKTEIEYTLQDQQKKEDRALFLYGKTRDEEIRQEDFARADELLANEIARTDRKDTEKLLQLEQERLDNVKEAIAKLWVAPTGETYDELLGEYATAVKNQPKEDKITTGLKPWDYFLDNGVLKQVPAWGVSTGTAPAPSRTPTIKSSYTPEGTFKVDIANGATPRKSSRGYYECAMLVNDALGTAMPDLHTDKLKYNNSNVPVVGGAFIEKTNDQYGHTGIVESINADGTINIVETNYPVGAGVTRKTIDPSKRNIVGYYNPQTAWQSGYMDITDITLPEKTTEFKAKSFGYGTRMDNSDKILKTIDDKFIESGSTGEYLTPRWELVPNWLKWTEQQQYEQAQRDFINAKLRQESGAVISPQEFDNAKKQYFPRPGDTKETIEQKRKNRELVILEMFRNAGKTESGEDIQQVYKSLRQNSQNNITEPQANDYKWIKLPWTVWGEASVWYKWYTLPNS